jgi:hypothetical protein
MAVPLNQGLRDGSLSEKTQGQNLVTMFFLQFFVQNFLFSPEKTTPIYQENFPVSW